MTVYNQDSVILFLLTLSFSSLTEMVYTKNSLVSKEFGCTNITAGKWVERALNSGYIKEDGLSYRLATTQDFLDQKKSEAKDKSWENEKMAISEGVRSGKVVFLSTAKMAA